MGVISLATHLATVEMETNEEVHVFDVIRNQTARIRERLDPLQWLNGDEFRRTFRLSGQGGDNVAAVAQYSFSPVAIAPPLNVFKSWIKVLRRLI